MTNITRTIVEENLTFVARWSTGCRDFFTFGQDYEPIESDYHYIKDIDLVCIEGQPEVIRPFIEAYSASRIFSVEDYMLSIGLIDSKVYTEAREAKKLEAEKQAKLARVKKARELKEARKPLVNSDLASQLKNLVF
jgi:hypothetical protein